MTQDHYLEARPAIRVSLVVVGPRGIEPRTRGFPRCGGRSFSNPL